MKRILLMALLGVCLLQQAIACDANKHLIDKLILKGDVTITFKPNGEASTVTCNTKKYTAKQCEHLGEHIFDYYHKHKKG